MTIINLGSINWDRVYRVPRFPVPGETLQARSGQSGLGGKGLNQSVAIVRSGGKVRHLGAVGGQDGAILSALSAIGIDTANITAVNGVETGSALILVDDAAENQIVLDPGANRQQDIPAIRTALRSASETGWFLFQNETNARAEALDAAKSAGFKTALAAAPFDARDVLPLLPQLDLLAVNEIEHKQLCDALPAGSRLPPDLGLFISRGARGASLSLDGVTIEMPAFAVTPVDTTGAGDTALGAFLARMDAGDAPEAALRFAMAAAAIQVTRPGAATAIPTYAEVTAFLEQAK